MVEFLNLKRINDKVRSELQKTLEDILDSGWYIRGKKCDEFENQFAEYSGAKHCIGVANGYTFPKEKVDRVWMVGRSARAYTAVLSVGKVLKSLI